MPQANRTPAASQTRKRRAGGASSTGRPPEQQAVGQAPPPNPTCNDSAATKTRTLSRSHEPEAKASATNGNVLVDSIAVGPGRVVDVLVPRDQSVFALPQASVVPTDPPPRIRLRLTAPVGPRGRNAPGDVTRARDILTRLGFAPASESLAALADSIRKYQRAHGLRADGRIDPGEATQQHINQTLAVGEIDHPVNEIDRPVNDDISPTELMPWPEEGTALEASAANSASAEDHPPLPSRPDELLPDTESE